MLISPKKCMLLGIHKLFLSVLFTTSECNKTTCKLSFFALFVVLCQIDVICIVKLFLVTDCSV